MKRPFCLALAGVLAVALSTGIFAANEPYTIAKGTASVDADLTDFVKAGANPIILKGQEMAYPTVEDVDGLSATAYFMYDAKNIYVGVDVIDDSMDFGRSINAWWDQDAIEFFIGPKQFAMVIDPDTDKPVWGVTEMMDAGRAVMIKKTPKGWAAEGALSIVDLNDMFDAGVAPGNHIQFSIGVDRSMSPEGGRVGLLYFPIGWGWGAVDTFATGTFAK